MTTNITNQVNFLATSRQFPTEINQLTVEINRAYVDTASTINIRTIGIFSTNKNNQTGESWFFTSQRRQSLRQIYTFTAAGNIPHNINFNSVYQFSPKSYGSFTDGTNWYGVIYAGSTAIAGEVSSYVTPTNIVILSGAGAPTIISGTIVLEWITNI